MIYLITGEALFHRVRQKDKWHLCLIQVVMKWQKNGLKNTA